MQLLADENIQQPTVRHLQSRGWDILWIPDVGLAGALDSRVFEYAQEGNRALLTYNADFVDMRALVTASGYAKRDTCKHASSSSWRRRLRRCRNEFLVSFACPVKP